MRDEMTKPDPAIKAANAARVLGVICVLFAAVIFVAMFFLSRSPGTAGPTWILIFVGLLYLTPGVALLVLSGPTRRGKMGPTIAVMVLAILIALFLWLMFAGSVISAISASGMSIAGIAPALLIGIFALVATLLAVYCVQSLRFPDREEPVRGFEPIVGTAIEIPERSA